MRATTQLLDHLGLATWGVLTNNAGIPVTMGDLYTDQLGDTLPDNQQLYSCAERVIAWWKQLNQKDSLTMIDVFRSRMMGFAQLANSILGNPAQTVSFDIVTLNSPRTALVSVWDTRDDKQALFFSLRFPDENEIESLKADGKLCRPFWSNLVSMKGLYGFMYNGIACVRTNHQWGVVSARKFPENVDS